jgi:apolipoprotein N-acyltransferase
MRAASNWKMPACYGLAVASGLLLAMSYAMHPLWWAAWLAPAPIIVAALLAPVGSRRHLTLLAGLIGGVSSFAYHVTMGGWWVAVVILLLVALAWSSAVGLAIRFVERGQALLGVLAVPVTWAAIDTLLIHLSPHGSAGSIAYSQMDALPVIQGASLGGVPEVTFVVLLGGSLLGLVAGRAFGLRLRGLPAAIAFTLAIVGASLSFGALRLREPPPARATTVALIATDGIRTQPRSWAALWQAYGAQVERAASQGTIIILPESVVRLPAAEADQAALALAAYAAQRRTTIVVGVIVEEAGRLTNRALVAQPDGSHLWYVKQHLVPGFEAAMTPGPSPLLLAAPAAAVGVAICKDMHFPTLERDYARDGARLMLVPANDFEVDDWLTARMTMMRGVEGGSAIARAARHGFSFVSDRYGRIVVEHRSGSAMAALIASAPAYSGGITVYTRAGDLFGWGCVLFWAALLLLRTGRLSPPRHRGKDMPLPEQSPIESQSSHSSSA